jgi:ABC-type thiamine transport system ATPase subunit
VKCRRTGRAGSSWASPGPRQPRCRKGRSAAPPSNRRGRLGWKRFDRGPLQRISRLQSLGPMATARICPSAPSAGSQAEASAWPAPLIIGVVRISSVCVTRWRNLADLRLDVPTDLSLVCLVGENGTGKSNLLELIAGVAAHLGLTPGAQVRRGLFQSEPHDISVTLKLPETFEMTALPIGDETYRDLMTHWDHTLTYRSASPVTAEPSGVSAGGIADPSWARQIASVVVTSISSQPEVAHLYLDAERSFPPLNLQDQEIWNLMRQDQKVPAYVRQQAAVMTQNMYSEWVKSMLAQAIRSDREYRAQAVAADRAGQVIPAPIDELAGLRSGIRAVLPHLDLKRLDQDQRTLVFDSAGQELRYESLSGGEREIVFLVGQIERFKLRKGLLLLDEPELHLNPDLLRSWLEYVRGSVIDGQVWIATHALEAVEVAGLRASIVFERSDDRLVRSALPLGDRPVLSTLAGAVGTPALSLARSRFVLVEGERPGRERERFANVLDSPPAERFVECGGCADVVRKFAFIKEFAAESDQLRVGAIVDRDLRTDAQVRQLEADTGVHVLPVHEIENFFLEPGVVEALMTQSGRRGGDGQQMLQRHSDALAGRWILDAAATEQRWSRMSPAVRERARTMTWAEFAADLEGGTRLLAELDDSIEVVECAQRRVALAHAARRYQSNREDPSQMWRQCFGKEVMSRVAIELELRSSEAMESRVLQLWSSNAVSRPTLLAETRAYLDAIVVLP